MNPVSLIMVLSLLSGGNTAWVPSGTDTSPDYRERSWVEDRLLKLTRELPLSPKKAETVRRVLEQEYMVAREDRRSLARQSTDTERDETRSDLGSGMRRGGSSGGRMGRGNGTGEEGSRQSPDRLAGGRVNAALVKRARNRYLVGDENVMSLLTDEQKTRFPDICSPRETLPDTTIMMMESLDLNDTQTQRIHPILEARSAKMRSILTLEGDRAALFQAMREAKKAFDTRIESLLNDSQKKKFRKLNNRSARSQGRPGGGGRGMGMGR